MRVTLFNVITDDRELFGDPIVRTYPNVSNLILMQDKLSFTYENSHGIKRVFADKTNNYSYFQVEDV